jgi:hypothetical protein
MAANTNTMSENTPKAPTIRWNKVRVFAILFLIIGGYIMLRAGANYDGATQTAIVFEAGNLADVPHIIPTDIRLSLCRRASANCRRHPRHHRQSCAQTHHYPSTVRWWCTHHPDLADYDDHSNG